MEEGFQSICLLREMSLYRIGEDRKFVLKSHLRQRIRHIPQLLRWMTVTTVFNGSNPFPMNLMVRMIRKMLLKDMNRNMVNLKGILEGK